MKVNEKLGRTARAHDGLLTRKEWVAAGNSQSSWYRRDNGLLVRCGPGAARLAGAPITPEQRIRAAVLASRNTVASHRSAAYLWGIDIVGDEPVDLISTVRSSGPALENVVIHRPLDRADLRPVPRKSIPTTNPMRTLLDLGAVAPSAVPAALEQLLIAGTVNVAGVARTLFQHRKPGRSGVGPLRLAIEELALGNKPPDSVLESAMAAVFARASIGDWIFHEWVAGIELDFAFPRQCVDVEVDGWATHSTRAQFERDRERDAELGAAGWLVLRFSWRHVTRSPNWVASRVGATLASRR